MSNNANEAGETTITYYDSHEFERVAREATGEVYDPSIRVFYETDFTHGKARSIVHQLNPRTGNARTNGR